MTAPITMRKIALNVAGLVSQKLINEVGVLPIRMAGTTHADTVTITMFVPQVVVNGVTRVAFETSETFSPANFSRESRRLLVVNIASAFRKRLEATWGIDLKAPRVAQWDINTYRTEVNHE